MIKVGRKDRVDPSKGKSTFEDGNQTIMSTAPANSSRPVPPKTYPREQNKAGKASQKAQLAATYCHPLPLIPRPPPIPSPSPSRLAALASIFRSAPSATLENPWCTGVWDPYTGTVWVTEPKDVDILWTSRSEPSWWKRKVREEMGGGNCTSSSSQVQLARTPSKLIPRPSVISIPSSTRTQT
jgi:hypothetical protein